MLQLVESVLATWTAKKVVRMSPANLVSMKAKSLSLLQRTGVKGKDSETLLNVFAKIKQIGLIKVGIHLIMFSLKT